MEIVLVNSLTDSAGKTTASLGLFDHFSNEMDVGLFKPFAANDYWNDYDVVLDGLEEGKIFGNDSKLFSEQLGVDPYRLNPVHRLWCPSSICGKDMGMGGEYDSVLLDRIYGPEEGCKVFKNSNVNIPDEILDKLDNSIQFFEFSDVEELNDYMRNYYQNTVEKSFDELQGFDTLIFESYSDISTPVELNFDVVVTLEPGIAHVSDGERYMKAHRSVSERRGEYGKEVISSKVLKLIDYDDFEVELFSSSRDRHEVYSKLSNHIVDIL